MTSQLSSSGLSRGPISRLAGALPRCVWPCPSEPTLGARREVTWVLGTSPRMTPWGRGRLRADLNETPTLLRNRGNSLDDRPRSEPNPAGGGAFAARSLGSGRRAMTSQLSSSGLSRGPISRLAGALPGCAWALAPRNFNTLRSSRGDMGPRDKPEDDKGRGGGAARAATHRPPTLSGFRSLRPVLNTLPLAGVAQW